MPTLHLTRYALALALATSIAAHADIEDAADAPPLPSESYDSSDPVSDEMIGDGSIPIGDRGYGEEQVESTWDWIRSLFGVRTDERIR